MIVRGAEKSESEPACEGIDGLPVFGGVIAMIPFDPEEPRLGHRRDRLLGQEALPRPRPGMGENRDPAGLQDDLNGLDGIGSPMVDVVGPRGMQGAAEGRRAILEGPRLDERVGDVRPADGTVLGRTATDVLPGDREVLREALDHRLGARPAARARLVQSGDKARRIRVRQQSEQMHGDALGRAAHLHPAHEGDARIRHGRFRFGPALESVMVGEAEDVQARVRARGEEFSGGVGAV